MNKQTVSAAVALAFGIALLGLLAGSMSLAAPLLPDTNLSEADASFLGENWHDRSGYSVAGAGDVDGDGYDDFVIGAPAYDEEGGTRAGQSYLILGQDSGWTRDTSLSQANASFRGETEGDQPGCSVSGAGDVNGDGYHDFLIGSRGGDASATVTDAGKAYLILGRPTVSWTMDMSLTLDADVSFLGENGNDQAGHSVAGIEDVDGDGHDDFLIGAPFHNATASVTNTGKTYLVLGGPSIGERTSMSLTTDASASFVGEAEHDRSGYSLAGAGDVNGDGYADFLIGAPYYDASATVTNTGKTYLILGRPVADWAMDFDLSNADASFLGENAGDLAGYSVDGAGDVNGDGYDDFLIGAPINKEGASGAGQTYLILGRGTADWGMDFALSNADASFRGEATSDRSGSSVSGAGDVNSDGYDDFVIGAWGSSEPSDLAGQAYVILGRAAADWGMDFDLSNADASYWGENQDDYAGFSVSGGGDVNADGYDDLLVGAWNNPKSGSQAGQTYLVMGNGLSLSKTASATSPTVGERFTYSISYANTTYTTATGVVITDSVPADTSYISCTGGAWCSETHRVVTWDVGDVASQTSGHVTLAVQVNSALSHGIVITNTAYLSAANVHNPLTTLVTGSTVLRPEVEFVSNSPVCLRIPMLFTDTSQSATVWLWDFGDGVGTSSAQNPSYTYTEAGDYTVTLTATNSGGYRDNHQASVTVNPLPWVGFTFRSPVYVGETVVFTNTTSDAESYEWDFGDGVGTSIVHTPSYTYTEPGDYTVTLKATNAYGCSDLYQSTIEVYYGVYLPMVVKNFTSSAEGSCCESREHEESGIKSVALRHHRFLLPPVCRGE